MASTFTVPAREWENFLEEVELAFERPVPPHYRSGTVNLDELFKACLPGPQDLMWRGRVVLGHDLRLALGAELGKEPSSFTREARLKTLLPGPGRKVAWQRIQEHIEGSLPRLGMPRWAQQVWGAGLLAGLVMLFIWPLWGLLLFLGGVLLSYRVERWAWAFQYSTLDTLIGATVRQNWPLLELGMADDDRLRLVLMEIVSRRLELDMDPAAPLPVVHVHDPWTRPAPQWHILNGDALREQFQAWKIPGQTLVMRECLVEGPVAGEDDFWSQRKAFISEAYAASSHEYDQWVTTELAKFATMTSDAEVNLWFEDDLFCQANLWFVLHYQHKLGIRQRLYRVFPVVADSLRRWMGFGGSDATALLQGFEGRVPIGEADLNLACQLWEAYSQADFPRLVALSHSPSPCFHDLEAVVAAHVARFPAHGGLGRPERTLQAILAQGHHSFGEIFKEFSLREGIYGFGDTQVRRMLEPLLADSATA